MKRNRFDRVQNGFVPFAYGISLYLNFCEELHCSNRSQKHFRRTDEKNNLLVCKIESNAVRFFARNVQRFTRRSAVNKLFCCSLSIISKRQTSWLAVHIIDLSRRKFVLDRHSTSARTTEGTIAFY